ncbi:AMED_5909 family protein [Amycolatopsis sp. cg13]|uniref:AMED_5909 family protein n=1 Tax=Amycolatopsis sp. cg13 TaxID=3238807 RepID=UPI0035237916
MTTKSEPATLEAAHSTAMSRRPASDAARSEWVAFHLANAAMYRTVADFDRWHHHEALYWADYEERRAARLSSSDEAAPIVHIGRGESGDSKENARSASWR